ncbi:hypothetical protein PV11_08710 [Exophiala sideris]|uniref:DUF300-domain-containing protein n=1 Tax=Exophiala sideris TaxID=1016849 RepID=A0A0D1VLJ0_9EURO|nr:hypothetical protein PV11_08710 [Exophiala sideris]
MPWPKCNSTLEDLKITEDDIWDGHTFHEIGLGVGIIFTFIAVVISFFLIGMHATHYLKPWEQKHIIRILFMVPVYAAVSLLSYYYYNHSVYFEVIRDCYEAFAIASFFSLLSAYIAPDLHQQKIYFRTITPKNWIFPIRQMQRCAGGPNGWLRTPRSGLTWFNVIWVCVFQYCFIRVFFTIVAVITQSFDLYCLESLKPAFSHVWIMGFESVGVTIAMYSLIQFYYQIKDDIRQHKPLLKITAVKLVIFLSFWQTTLISFLTSSGVITANNKVQTPDIKVGIPALLLCIEMAFFAAFHVWSFSWKPYTRGSRELLSEAVPGEGQLEFQGGFMGTKAIYDAFNAWDMLKATGRGARWLFKGRKTRMQDASYDMTRKNTQGSDFGAEGQKLSGLAAPTAYTGASAPPPRYGGEEGDVLLAHGQGMPVSNYQPARVSGDNSPDGHSDIGVASSSYDDKCLSRYDQPPQATYPPYPASNGQQAGAAVPYPPPTQQQQQQQPHEQYDSRYSRPQYPPAGDPTQQPYEQYDNRSPSRPPYPSSGDPRSGHQDRTRDGFL